MKILVTGGKGYIGSITASALEKNGQKVVIFDKKDGQDIQDINKLKQLLATEKIEAVMHFAAYIEMGESMTNPQKYFENNFVGSQHLIQAMVDTKVKYLIFSSTAGVYGNPIRIPIKEDDRKEPENPYGQSKLMVEETLDFYDRIYGLKSISLRYFNAAGASPAGEGLGENHQPESHLIPNLIKAILENREFSLFGNDYPTKDGTCIRDYIHVLDLAEAHILALKALISGHKSEVYNVGAGKGYSSLEVIKMVEKVSAKKLKLKIGPRRPGDANELVADPTKIQKDLGWRPKYSDLETIVRSAWQWHKKQL
ncbi:MAG: UDP-glucose 4-epimerase GalE [Candidatus Beckwithbacteria bacterium]|nr:UDP-glucose 4-epimerase GalE [Candidatus Beckwithbacteria bacterium]